MSLVTLVTAGTFANVRPEFRAIASTWQTAAKCATEKQSG